MSSIYSIFIVIVETYRGRDLQQIGPVPPTPDIIEDDISDYPKDRNLSLSVIFQISSCMLGGCGS